MANSDAAFSIFQVLVQAFFDVLTHSFLKITGEASTIIIPLLWMKVLRHREVTSLAQDHTAGSTLLCCSLCWLLQPARSDKAQFPTAQWDWPPVNLPKEWTMDRGVLKLFRKGPPDLDWLFLRYGPTTRLPELPTDFGNSSSQDELSFTGVTKAWTEHTSEEPWTQGKSLPLVSLEGADQDELTSWSVFTLWEAVISRLLAQRLLGSG